MTNKELFQKARKIGPAIWLLIMYWAMCRPDSWPWFIVDDGKPQTDEEYASFLGVSTYTLARWRQRLMRAGVVEAEKADSGAYRIRVQRPRLAGGLLRTLEEHSESRKWEAVLAAQMIQ